MESIAYWEFIWASAAVKFDLGSQMRQEKSGWRMAENNLVVTTLGSFMLFSIKESFLSLSGDGIIKK